MQMQGIQHIVLGGIGLIIAMFVLGVVLARGRGLKSEFGLVHFNPFTRKPIILGAGQWIVLYVPLLTKLGEPAHRRLEVLVDGVTASIFYRYGPASLLKRMLSDSGDKMSPSDVIEVSIDGGEPKKVSFEKFREIVIAGNSPENLAEHVEAINLLTECMVVEDHPERKGMFDGFLSEVSRTSTHSLRM